MRFKAAFFLLTLAFAAQAADYSPFGRDAYLTSSFGENRGTRYHAGFDYSTLMEEGWVVYAPEDGIVKELQTSPFGYGKAMYYQGNSGVTWVYAHQSSFGKLDSLVFEEMYKTQKNDIKIKPGVAYKKGDTLSFAGSSGIGNPHLHLETRINKDVIVNPVFKGTIVSDTMDPQIFGIATWNSTDVAFTDPVALENGCVEVPSGVGTNMHIAVKIADYSREPKENPMSVRRVTLLDGKKKVFNSLLDTLRFSTMLNIRDELLWTEEADTAGDWHYIDAKLSAKKSYTIEVEDYAGHILKQQFSFQQKCKGNSPILLTKVQESPLFTALAKPMLDLSRCESGTKFKAIGDKEIILAQNLCETLPNKVIFLNKAVSKFPKMQKIQYDGPSGSGEIAVYQHTSTDSSLTWNFDLGKANLSQKISKLTKPLDGSTVLLAATRTHTDSLDYIEFHPKGLQFMGKWEVCIDSTTASAPLYWLGETSRDWFIFSKQSNKGMRCASTNELRDISWLNDTEAPTLGTPYWEKSMIYGKKEDVLRIPVLYKYAGILNGNAINVTNGSQWIAAEFDSEPKEIVLDKKKLPPEGGKITIELEDEAGNKAKYEISVPKM